MSEKEFLKHQLHQQGYVLIPGLLNSIKMKSLNAQVKQLLEAEGHRAGAEFKQEPGARRLANLVNKGEEFWDLVQHPVVLEFVQSVLGDEFKLSSLNARVAEPENDYVQPLHCDMAAVPDKRGFWVCNCIWMLDDFTRENGSLRVVPGSHQSGTLPDAWATDLVDPHPEEIIVTGKAGSVIVLNAHTWHGGLANKSKAPRTAIHSFFCRRDKPQQQNQKNLLDDRVQARMPPEMREILALDDFDGTDDDSRVRSGFLR